jgi:hypothetical protein
MLPLRQLRRQRCVAVLLITIFVVSAALSVYNQSSTWDDPPHLVGGVAQWQSGDPRLNVDHPPLARLVGALPALFLDMPNVSASSPKDWESAELFALASHSFGAIEDRLLWPGRLCMLSFSVLLGWLLYRWCAELHGEEVAWFPLTLFAFCPPLLGSAALVYTDMPATALFFASVYSWWRYLRVPTWKTLALVSLSVAAAFATKHSALMLVPLLVVLGAAGVLSNISGTEGVAERCKIVGRGLVSIAITTVLLLNLIYGFDGTGLTPPQYLQRAQLHPGHEGLLLVAAQHVPRIWPSWLPVPLPFYYVCGIFNIFGSMHNGGASSFLGEAGWGGWNNYFPMLFLVKMTIPSLIFIIAGASSAFARIGKTWANLLFVALPPALLVTSGSLGHLQIGFRHMLPTLPFLFLLAAYALPRCKTMVHWLAVGSLVIWNEAASLAIHPDYLMYFNFIGGGADQGWRISAAGDDQGQGDADLLRWLQARGVRELAFGANGWGNVILNRNGIATKPLPCEDTGGLVAAHLVSFIVAATGLEKTRCYDWMRLRPPDVKIDHNIFIWNATVAGEPHPTGSKP